MSESTERSNTRAFLVHLSKEVLSRPVPFWSNFDLMMAITKTVYSNPSFEHMQHVVTDMPTWIAAQVRDGFLIEIEYEVFLPKEERKSLYTMPWCASNIRVTNVKREFEG